MNDPSELLDLVSVAGLVGVSPWKLMVWVLKGLFPPADNVLGTSHYWSRGLVTEALIEREERRGNANPV